MKFPLVNMSVGGLELYFEAFLYFVEIYIFSFSIQYVWDHNFWLFFCIQKHIFRWKNLSNIQHRFSQLVVWYVPENVQNINYLYTARGSLHKVKQRDIWYTKIYVHIIGPPGLPNKWSISLFNSNEPRGIKKKRPNARRYEIIPVI